MMLSFGALFFLIGVLSACDGAPTYGYATPSAGLPFVIPSHFAVFLSVGFFVLCGLVIFGCTCWRPKSANGVTGVDNCAGQLNETNVSTLQNRSEFAIFPPCSSVINLQPVNRLGGYEEEKVIFEPLPDILPKRDVNGQNLAQSSKPAHFSALLKKKSSLHDWFDDPSSNFPRNQLQYLQEIGNGWFGRIVEGEAQMISTAEDKTKVIVKILREEASPSEHLYFLHEVKPYRDLHHPNIVRLLGRCLETDPFLLIMEYTLMSLKTYLLKNHDEVAKQSAAGSRQLLKITSDIVSGLAYMHEHNFVHTDLAAHNCFVSQDDIIKIGDYGTSYDVFKEDYYCLEDIALPIRWYSPESLRCSEATIETQEVTKEANVWSLGIVLWEVLELGKLPYPDLTNEAVLQKVIIEKEVFPKEPVNEYPYKKQMYKIMLLCWEPLASRPKVQDIQRLLQHLLEQSFSKSISFFEHRWNALESKVPPSSLKFESDFVDSACAAHNTSDMSSLECNLSESSAFDNSGCDSVRENSYSCRSPSLKALNGSYDEIGMSDVEPMSDAVTSCVSQSVAGSSQSITMSDTSKEIFYDRTEIDVTPEQITAALRDLDAMLASEASILGFDSRPATLERPKARKETSHSLSSKRNDNFFWDKAFIAKGSLESRTVNSDDSLDFNSSFGDVHHQSKTAELVCVPSSVAKISDSAFVSGESQKGNGHAPLGAVLSAPIVLQEEDDDDDVEVQRDSGRSENSVRSSSNEGKDVSLSSAVDEVGPAVTVDCKTSQDTSVPEMLKDSGPFSSEVTFPEDSDDGRDSKTFSVPNILITQDSVQSSQNEASHVEQEECIVSFQPTLKKYKFVLKEEPVTTEGSDMASDFRLDRDAKYNLDNGPVTSTPKKAQSSLLFESCASVESGIENRGSHSVVPSATIQSESGAYACDFGDGISEITSHPIYMSCTTDSTETGLTSFVSAKNEVEDMQPNSSHSKETYFSVADSENCGKPRSKSLSSASEDSFITFNCSQAESVCESPGKDCTIKEEAKQAPGSDNKPFPDLLSSTCPATVDKPFGENGIFDSANQYEAYCTFDDASNRFSGAGDIMLSDNITEFSEMIPSKHCKSSTSGHDFAYEELSGEVGSGSKRCPVITLSEEGDEATMSDTTSDSFMFKRNCQWSEDHSRNESRGLRYLSELPEHSVSDTEPSSFVYKNARERSHADSPALFTRTVSSVINNNINYDSYGATGGHDVGELHQSKSSNFNTDYNQNLKQKSSYVNDSFCSSDMKIMDLESESKMEADPDDYDSQMDDEEVLKIDIETNEAILVDTSESLIGFVPSRSIEMLQECECLATQFESNSSFDEGLQSSSVSPSPSSSNIHNCKNDRPDNFLQLNQNIADSKSRFSDDNLTAESSSPPRSEGYSGSDEAMGIDASEKPEMRSSPDSRDDSPMYNGNFKPFNDLMFSAGNNRKNFVCRNPDSVNNNTEEHSPHINETYEDVMLGNQPTKPVVWHSDEALDVLHSNLARAVIIEGKEVLAGYTSPDERALNDMDNVFRHPEFGSSDFLDRLAVSASPSPMGSAASTPCRETVYTPDFESESAESSSSCSSTSGSFECIHNKFKDVSNISLASEKKEDTPPGDGSEECSPLKIFSKTWDCHATPNKGLLKSPEKKVEPMKKSVSFHEDPDCVFQYPPASDSSEEEYVEEEDVPWTVDYSNFADWDLQVNEDDQVQEMIEIEELDSEPYNRSIGYYRGLSSRSYVGSSLYTITGLLEEDLESSLPDMSETPVPQESDVTVVHSQSGKRSPDKVKEMMEKENIEVVDPPLQIVDGADNFVKDVSPSSKAFLVSTNEGIEEITIEELPTIAEIAVEHDSGDGEVHDDQEEVSFQTLKPAQDLQNDTENMKPTVEEPIQALHPVVDIEKEIPTSFNTSDSTPNVFVEVSANAESNASCGTSDSAGTSELATGVGDPDSEYQIRNAQDGTESSADVTEACTSAPETALCGGDLETDIPFKPVEDQNVLSDLMISTAPHSVERNCIKSMNSDSEVQLPGETADSAFGSQEIGSQSPKPDAIKLSPLAYTDAGVDCGVLPPEGLTTSDSIVTVSGSEAPYVSRDLGKRLDPNYFTKNEDDNHECSKELPDILMQHEGMDNTGSSEVEKEAPSELGIGAGDHYLSMVSAVEKIHEKLNESGESFRSVIIAEEPESIIMEQNDRSFNHFQVMPDVLQQHDACISDVSQAATAEKSNDIGVQLTDTGHDLLDFKDRSNSVSDRAIREERNVSDEGNAGIENPDSNNIFEFDVTGTEDFGKLPDILLQQHGAHTISDVAIRKDPDIPGETCEDTETTGGAEIQPVSDVRGGCASDSSSKTVLIDFFEPNSDAAVFNEKTSLSGFNIDSNQEVDANFSVVPSFSEVPFDNGGVDVLNYVFPDTESGAEVSASLQNENGISFSPKQAELCTVDFDKNDFETSYILKEKNKPYEKKIQSRPTSDDYDNRNGDCLERDDNNSVDGPSCNISPGAPAGYIKDLNSIIVNDGSRDDLSRNQPEYASSDSQSNQPH